MLLSQYRRRLAKEAPIAYGVFKAAGQPERDATTAEVKDNVEHLTGTNLGFLCLHSGQVRRFLSMNLI